MTLKVLVDEALCAAHGQCYAVAPDLFQADEQGYCAQAGKGLLDVPEGLEDEARLGESVCPETAIRVIEQS